MTKYSTIVADPPWEVKAGRALGEYQIVNGKQIFSDADTKQTRELSYPTLTVDELCMMKVPAADNAHLYLWTINSYLPYAFKIMANWGFVYSTTLVWAKAPMGGGLGGCYGLATEYCLFGRRGSLPAMRRIGRNWFDWKRPYKNGHPQHSAKPPEFMQMVESVSPGPYLEMFARNKRDGWHSWGNEIESDVEIL